MRRASRGGEATVVATRTLRALVDAFLECASEDLGGRAISVAAAIQQIA
jgi:hypothetical protein